VIPAGLSFCIPFLENTRNVSKDWAEVANKEGIFIELSEQQTDAKARQAQTRDNVTLQQLDAVIYWRIVDPIKALYEVDRLPISVRDTTLNSLRARVGRRSLDELLASREALSEEVASDVADAYSRWGIRLSRIEVQEIRYDESTANAMRQQMEAERRSRAASIDARARADAEITLAKAAREAAVIRASGQAEALGLQSRAEAEYLITVGKATDPATASRLLLAQKYIDGFKIITENSTAGDKVYLPVSANGLGLAMLEGAGR